MGHRAERSDDGLPREDKEAELAANQKRQQDWKEPKEGSEEEEKREGIWAYALGYGICGEKGGCVGD